jgi:hypothetical protein
MCWDEFPSLRGKKKKRTTCDLPLAQQVDTYRQHCLSKVRNALGDRTRTTRATVLPRTTRLLHTDDTAPKVRNVRCRNTNYRFGPPSHSQVPPPPKLIHRVEQTKRVGSARAQNQRSKPTERISPGRLIDKYVNVSAAGRQGPSGKSLPRPRAALLPQLLAPTPPVA